MSLSNLIVITGMSGVHKMLGNRKNGLIVEDLDTQKRRFVPSRKYQFTPLESISIYTNDGDTVALADVFKTMLERLEDCPLPPAGMNADQAFDYLGEILPNYDRGQVYFSDVKKLIRWFTFLNERDLLDFSEPEEEEENPDADNEENPKDGDGD